MIFLPYGRLPRSGISNIAMDSNPEVGYHTLLTNFTGTSSAQLSGIDQLYEIIAADCGVAMTLSDGEL